MLRRRPSGFTLIEVLVVVAIIGLMSTLGMASYFRFADTNKIRGAAQEAQTFLRDIQNRAKMGDRGTGACATNSDPENVLGNQFHGWKVTASGDQLTAWAECDNSTGGGNNNVIYTLPAPAVVDGNFEIFFPSLYYTFPVDAVTTGTLTIKDNTDDSIKYSFDISAGGNMSSVEAAN